MANEHSRVTFYHSPWSRSVAIRWLLEELNLEYDVRLVNIHQPTTVEEAYRSIQPHKKVPAIAHGQTIITERAAIAIYLADAYPEAGLAPAIGDPGRAAYLTSLVYVDAVYDPSVTAHFRGLRPQGQDYSFGAYDDMLKYLEKRLEEHPYAAGDRFSAADTQLGSALMYTMNVLQAVPRLPAFEAYVKRVGARPAHKRAQQLDAELAEKHLGFRPETDVVVSPTS